MKTRNKLIGVVILGASLYGCAATTQLTREQVHEQHQSIAQLDQSLQSARRDNVNILAPDSYAAAEQQLKTAYSAAEKGRRAEANQAADKGLTTLSKAQKDARESADVLAEVLRARDKTLSAGAQELFPKELAELEEDFGDTANLIEEGKLERAKQSRPQLSQAYADLELKSLKEGTIQRAKNAIATARENNAHKLAPKTFKSAEESLKVAMSVLEADRTAKERADASANKAVMEAQRAEQIAEIVKDYDRRDYSPEDIVLWYQEQLATVTSPLNNEVTFTDTNKQTVVGLRDSIAGLVQDRQRLSSANTTLSDADAAIAKLKADHAQEVARLKKQFAGEQAQMTMAQQEREERFARIRQMFNPEEATVFRQGDNVLISVHGFKFPPGSSEIQPQNFGIMNKVIQGIATFQAAKVQVAGHTDATGCNSINVSLSKQRANNVARFLTDVGRIPSDKITADGYGAQRPVATNATPEGRAENRRIEVLIVNE